MVGPGPRRGRLAPRVQGRDGDEAARPRDEAGTRRPDMGAARRRPGMGLPLHLPFLRQPVLPGKFLMLKWFGDRAKAVVLARARRATGHACDYMAERARVHAPVDSGDLKESIRVVPGPMQFQVVVGVDYADPVHNGH